MGFASRVFNRFYPCKFHCIECIPFEDSSKVLELVATSPNVTDTPIPNL